MGDLNPKDECPFVFVVFAITRYIASAPARGFPGRVNAADFLAGVDRVERGGATPSRKGGDPGSYYSAIHSWDTLADRRYRE